MLKKNGDNVSGIDASPMTSLSYGRIFCLESQKNRRYVSTKKFYFFLLKVWAQEPDTQKYLSSTYLSAVRVTAVKTTYFIESVYSKLRLSWLWHTFNLNNSKSTQ